MRIKDREKCVKEKNERKDEYKYRENKKRERETRYELRTDVKIGVGGGNKTKER